MVLDALRKLRAVAITAHAKIEANKLKNVPGKWEAAGHDADGTRNWLKCTHGFLVDKFMEEVKELIYAVMTREPIANILKEAGDVSAMAMMLADSQGCFNGTGFRFPSVVCLCGSTKFREDFMTANFEETMKGNIVLSVGFFMHTEVNRYILRAGEKEMLDDLHKRKIDLADEVLVINTGGYIGSSTRSEIEYAIMTGKPVRYREDPTKTVGPFSTTDASGQGRDSWDQHQ